MIAKEMFEELGYTCERETIHLSDDYTEEFYHYKNYNPYGNIDNFITFVDPRKKMYLKYNASFGIEELKAINKQVEELGW